MEGCFYNILPEILWKITSMLLVMEIATPREWNASKKDLNVWRYLPPLGLPILYDSMSGWLCKIPFTIAMVCKRWKNVVRRYCHRSYCELQGLWKWTCYIN